MSDQENEDQNKNFPSEELQEESNALNLLHLDSTNSTTTTTTTPHHHHTPCSACGCSGPSAPTAATVSSSNKRRSPDPHDQLPKKPKKLFHDPQETAAGGSHSPYGFTHHISLPFTTAASSFPVLRRCTSDPSSAPVASDSPPGSAKMAGMNVSATPLSKGCATLPPRPPPLTRSVSDPSPTKAYSRSLSSNDMTSDDNPFYQMMRKMKDFVKEMNQFCDENLPEAPVQGQEGSNQGAEEENYISNSQKNDSETDAVESVCVERTGECLLINFRCPCSKGYRILLSGRECYYRLM